MYVVLLAFSLIRRISWSKKFGEH